MLKYEGEMEKAWKMGEWGGICTSACEIEYAHHYAGMARTTVALPTLSSFISAVAQGS